MPFAAAPQFPNLFRAIDTEKELGIESYGASITTMDEIFLTVTKSTEEEKEGNDTENDEEILQKLAESVKLLEGFALMKQQFKGAFIKCLLHAVRNWKIILMQLVLPAIMTSLAVIQILSIPEIGAQPELSLSLEPYNSMLDLNLNTPLDIPNNDGLNSDVKDSFISFF